MKCCFVIPVYNHGAALPAVIRQLAVYKLPVIVVDDGNDSDNKARIKKAVESCPDAVLVERGKNGGKGLAVRAGVLKARELGFSHIFQIDADGQHDAARAGFFLEQAEQNPNAVICGYPEYDASAPARRVLGRKIANSWVHVVTFSKDIRDAMIGFRIYPVDAYYKLLKRRAVLDNRMGYDIDILVHFSWAGVPVISQSVKVIYPADGISNFRLVRDNLRISMTYTRLFIGMIFRLPVLAYRAIRRKARGGHEIRTAAVLG